MTVARDTWDRRFMRIAEEARTWSKDPDKQVGALLVSPDRRQLAVGYNGPPAGFHDDYGVRSMADNLRMGLREAKLAATVHAEVNAILNCHQRPERWTLYSTSFPCYPCATIIAQSGVTRVVAPPPAKREESSWAASHEIALELLRVQMNLEVDFFK